jgi:tRNA 2-selenouridine synthase
MPALITQIQLPIEQNYSEIIDVRSPSEFAEDHIPSAINLPVLNDSQRAEVGTLYKQVDPFTARKVGAALVSQNIATHLNHHFANNNKNYQPLIYCWRGGQRSRSLATVLAEIGWQVTLISGGYKTYRAYVRQQLELLPAQFNYRILAGPTGSGKTHILQQLQQRGANILDLEALANHRGSVLGEEWDRVPRPQPSQKYFESLLLQALQSHQPGTCLWVESESNKIGNIYLPLSLWNQMKQSSGVAIEVPMRDRIQWLLREYSHLSQNPQMLKTKLQHMKSLYGKQTLQQWEQMIDAGDFRTLIAELLECHYDRTYRRSLNRCYPHIQQTVTLPDLSDPSINSLLDSLINY